MESFVAVQEFRLPDPGEGLVEAEIVTWRVAVGDRVEVNDIIVEVETSKSLVELPSPYAGTVTALLVSEGDTVDVGKPIISIDDEAAAGHSGTRSRRRDLVPPTEATRGRHTVEAAEIADGCRAPGRPGGGAGRLRAAHDRRQAAAAQDRAGRGVPTARLGDAEQAARTFSTTTRCRDGPT